MLYEFHRGSTAAAATRNIRLVYGNVINTRMCQRWFHRFMGGDYSLIDRPRSGRPSVVDPETLEGLVETDPQQTAQDLAAVMSCDRSTITRHLHTLGKTNRAGVWVPHQLTEKNLMERVLACQTLLSRWESDPFLDRIVTGDEKWVLYVNKTRKRQWLSPGQQAVPTPKPGPHPKKVLLCVWWDVLGPIHFEMLENRTVTSQIYCEQLDRVD